MYASISGDPSLINMSDIIFTGKGNSAAKEGNTLYVVWKSTSNMTSEEFRSFSTLSAESNEAIIEMWTGEIVTFGEFGSGGENSEEEGSLSGSGSDRLCGTIYKVCTQIEVSNNTGIVKVEVTNGEEETSGREGCAVGMEGGEVEGDVNGEGVKVNLGNELTTLFHHCDTISVVMNVTYGLSNG